MKLIILFSLFFWLGGCQKSEEKKQSQIPPVFKSSGGSVGGSSPVEFCDVYVSADAFIFGKIKSVEMIQDPFFIKSQTGEWVAVSDGDLIECTGYDPVLKITISVENFLSYYNTTLENLDVDLMIGMSWFQGMNPSPSPSLHFDGRGTSLSSNEVSWNPEHCSENEPCPLTPGMEIGLFAVQHPNYNQWVISEGLIWFPGMRLEGERYSNIYSKSSIADIINATDECKDYQSPFTEERRDEKTKIDIINVNTPKCYQ